MKRVKFTNEFKANGCPGGGEGQAGQLQIELDWLKKERASGLTEAEKRSSMIEPNHPDLIICRQRGLLKLPRSSYHRTLTRLRGYETVGELVAGLTPYFEFYNHTRSHSSLDRKTPSEFYFSAFALERAA